jgi:hypothetical protein
MFIQIPDPNFYPFRISEPGSRIPDPCSNNSRINYIFYAQDNLGVKNVLALSKYSLKFPLCSLPEKEEYPAFQIRGTAAL